MAAIDTVVTILALMTRVLGQVFRGESWSGWRAVLRAAFGLELSPEQRDLVCQLTGRTILPLRPVRELWLLLGRRSGKSIIAALLIVWAVSCRNYKLSAGEVGVFMVIAADRRQSRVVKRYVSGLLRAHGSLAKLVDRETSEAIWLKNGLCIEIHTCSFKSLRGYTCIGAVVDEVAFWDSEDSANPDKEVLIALRAAMASQPDAMLIGLTSVYAQRGEVFRIHEKYYGNDLADDVLVVRAPTQVMNPTIDQRVIEQAYEDDPIAAAAEYGSEFRRDVEAFLPKDALEAVRMPGRSEQPFSRDVNSYVAFVDPSGGSGKDSMTLAIAHTEQDHVVLDLVREVRAPFSPEQAVKEFADVLRSYRLSTVTGDRYAGSWPSEQFRKFGITYEPSERSKSEIYQAFLPLVMSKRAELLDDARLLKQFEGLERRTARGGRDSIDHAPRKHDDVANAAAGALTLTISVGGGFGFAQLVEGGGFDYADSPWDHNDRIFGEPTPTF